MTRLVLDMQSVRAPNAIAIVELKLQGSNAREIVKSFSVLNGSPPYVESLKCEKVMRTELADKRYSRTKRHCPDCGAPVGYPYRKKSRKNGNSIRCRKCNARAVGKRPKKRTKPRIWQSLSTGGITAALAGYMERPEEPMFSL